MRTTVSIPDSIFHEAESMAGRMGMSRNEFYRRAVENYIASHRNDAVRDTLDAIYAEESSALHGALFDLQLASLPEEDW